MVSWAEAARVVTAEMAERDRRRRERQEARERQRELTLTMHASLLRQADCEPLQAVIGLHAPRFIFDDGPEAECEGCDRGDDCGMQDWPCPTINVIQGCI